MYTCIHMYVCVCARALAHLSMHYICSCYHRIYVTLRIHYINMYKYVCKYMRILINIDAYIHICIYVCMYVCIYVYIRMHNMHRHTYTKMHIILNRRIHIHTFGYIYTFDNENNTNKINTKT